jgi:hypothetical protein
MRRRNFIKKATIAGAVIPAIPSTLFGFISPDILKTGNKIAEQPTQPGDIPGFEAAPAETKVMPVEINDILSNPGIGWETTRSSKLDKNLPSWIPSTVRYMRWGWDKLEPVEGQIDKDFMEGIFSENREAGQTLGFRVMTAYPGRSVYPAWLKQKGGKILNVQVTIDEFKNQDTEVPDLDDPVVLQAHLDFIKRLGVLYDGHPDVDHIDLGSIGWWGEWHLSGSKNANMPSVENLRKVVEAYFDAFRKTPLVMLIGATKNQLLQYATERGAGWRADCFGDMNYHMMKYYTQALASNNGLNAWKKGPVAWETCWDMRKWVNEKWPLRFIFNYGLALHGSLMTNKSAPIPEGPGIREEIERFLKRLGYRFVLKELRHLSSVKAGGILKLGMKWQNIGSAPCYRPYKLAYKLSEDAEGKDGVNVIAGSVSVNQWLPGDIKLDVQEYFKNPVDLPLGEIYDVQDKITIPKDLKPGKYTLFLGVTDGSSDDSKKAKPVVQLAIKGRMNDGWYRLSEITLVK